MEEIYENVDQPESFNPRHSTNHTGPTSSEKSSYLGVTIFLGLLSVFLLVGVIIIGVLYGHSAAELSAVKDNVTALLQASNDKLSSMTEERDLLKANLTEMTKEMERLQNLSKQKKTCPEGWKMFSCICYFLSEKNLSWDKGRQDCRNRGADLVVIDSPEEQTSVSSFIKENTWIGLNDIEEEGTWKWIDGTPLTLNSSFHYWRINQPDNGDNIQEWGEEDCAHLEAPSNAHWNDLSCSTSLPWICEKIP